MFEAAIHDFVKQTGEDCLHAVPSLFEADLYKPLQVVVKKNRRYFWQSPKYQTQDFSLDEILLGQEKLSAVPITKEIFVKKYLKKSKLSLSGKFGAKIKTLFAVELEGSDYVHIESNFGDVEKEEVDAQKLLEVMKTRKLNLDHALVKQTRRKHRKVICVVNAIARTTQDCMITTDIEEKGSEEVDFDKDKGKPLAEKLKVVDINEKGTIDDEKNKAFTVRAETPLAFEVYELKVKSDGSVEIMFDRDTPGGFWVTGTDVTDGPQVDLSLYATFAPIVDLKTEDREKVTKTILRVCETPVVVDNFVKLLKQAFKAIKAKEAKTADIIDVLKDLGTKDVSCTDLLVFAGFTGSGTGLTGGDVVFPTVMTDKLSALRSVFEALEELEDDSTQELSKCTKNLSKPLLNLFQLGVDGKEIKMKDSRISQIYADSNAGQKLAHELGFTIKSFDTVSPPKHKQQLKGAYRAVYALWGTKEESN